MGIAWGSKKIVFGSNIHECISSLVEKSPCSGRPITATGYSNQRILNSSHGVLLSKHLC